MDSSKAKPNTVYEDFEVHIEWVHEAADDTLIAYLPGFRKEQLKVQVTTGGKLRIFGETPVGDNKISRFHKEIPIPSNCDQNKIRANFRGGMLHVKLPKLIVPVDHKPRQQQEETTTPSSAPAPAPAPAPAAAASKVPPQPAPLQPPTPAEHHAPQKQAAPKEELQAAAEKTPAKDNAASEAQHHDNAMEKDGGGKEKMEAKKVDGVDKKKVGSDYKQVVEGLVKGVKNPRKVMNMVLGALMAVVVAVYIRNLIRSLGGIYN